ncbi:MAG: PDZ domain-containing protein [SAR324 cluster bacterium]|nr:PDZ domain-containing protein [SAR324 cluster bacterium]
MNKIGTSIVMFGFFCFFIVLLITVFDTPDHEEIEITDAGRKFVQGSLAIPIALTTNIDAVAKNSQATVQYISSRIKLDEGHWQGLEVIELTPEIKIKLKIPMKIEGVLIDEVTLNALMSGLRGGDILIAINDNRVKTIQDVVDVSKLARNKKRAKMTVLRDLKKMTITLISPDTLGFAQAETAPMILPSDMRPHPDRGRCTECHPIGSIGHLTPDPDEIPLKVPVIASGMRRIHKDRGPCTACHIVTN